MNNIEYKELLKHPKWQKVRLEVMQRDNFTCQECGKGLEEGITLNVHHKRYVGNKLPWEYDKEDLITLCEKCHKNSHLKVSDKKRLVFYRGLIIEDSLTPAEKIIVSFLLNHINESFSQYQVSKKTCISRATISKFFSSNKDIDKYKKYIKSGYFYLKQSNKHLTGQLLIFYSWLVDLAKDKNIIYASRKKISEMYHVEEKDIRDYLHRLHKFGMIERDDNNNLILK